MGRAQSRLQHELLQSRPFASVQQEAMLSVLKTADVVRRRIARALAPFGVTPQQYNVLRVVRGAGEAGIPTLAIGERLIETTPGLTRLLDRLEAKGWVARWRCPRDRRQVLCRITSAGSVLLAALDPSMNHPASFTDALTAREATQLVTLLEKVRTGKDQENSKERCNEVDDD